MLDREQFEKLQAEKEGYRSYSWNPRCKICLYKDRLWVECLVYKGGYTPAKLERYFRDNPQFKIQVYTSNFHSHFSRHVCRQSFEEEWAKGQE